MMNPLWVDARDYLHSQGQPITTGNLNNAVDFLANNPQLRPSAVKGGSAGNAASIGAGLGAPTDQIVSTPLPPPNNPSGSPAGRTGGGRQGGSGSPPPS